MCLSAHRKQDEQPSLSSKYLVISWHFDKRWKSFSYAYIIPLVSILEGDGWVGFYYWSEIVTATTKLIWRVMRMSASEVFHLAWVGACQTRLSLLPGKALYLPDYKILFSFSTSNPLNKILMIWPALQPGIPYFLPSYIYIVNMRSFGSKVLSTRTSLNNSRLRMAQL